MYRVLIFTIILITLAACSDYEKQTETIVDIKLSDISDRDYSKTKGDFKPFNGEPKENYKKIIVNVKIINSKDAIKREIKIPDLRLKSIEDRVLGGGNHRRNNLGEDYAEMERHIIFYTEGLDEAEIRDIFNEATVDVTYNMPNEDFKEEHYSIGEEIVIANTD